MEHGAWVGGQARTGRRRATSCARLRPPLPFLGYIASYLDASVHLDRCLNVFHTPWPACTSVVLSACWSNWCMCGCSSSCLPAIQRQAAYVHFTSHLTMRVVVLQTYSF